MKDPYQSRVHVSHDYEKEMCHIVSISEMHVSIKNSGMEAAYSSKVHISHDYEKEICYAAHLNNELRSGGTTSYRGPSLSRL